MRHLRLALVLAAAFCGREALAAEPITQLELGDPARRALQAPLTLDRITDTRTGETLAPARLAQRLAGVRVLFVGEDHTDLDAHRVQREVIQALHRAGREVLIGLEMLPTPQQPVLDRWQKELLTEEQFLEESAWYEHWGHAWPYYRDIFLFARDNGLRLVAVNAPRDVISAVRMQGFDALTPEQRSHLPPGIDTANEEHRRLFRASFEEGDSLHAEVSPEQWEGLFRAQATWDAVMAWNAVRALDRHGEDAIVVVLLGSGHVNYGLGAERQLRDGFEGRSASLIPVQVRAPDGTEVPSVRASYADFVWGVPQQLRPEYPSLGVSLAGRLGRQPTKIIQVSRDSPAAQAGLAVGDVLLAIDARPVDSVASLRRESARYRWGDTARVKFQRGDETRTADVAFRAQTAPPASKPATGDARYRLDLAIDPAAQAVDVRAAIDLPPGYAGKRVDFLLASALEIVESEPRAARVAAGDIPGFSGINGSSLELVRRGLVARYRVQLPQGTTALRLRYRGKLDFALDAQQEEYTRGFRETPGIIGPEGVYLAGSTLWYPYFDGGLVRFELTSNVPEGWHLVSQGNGTSADAQTAHWDSGGAVDEIYLVGGPLTRYAQAAGEVEALVYLRKAEEPLARKYLTATAQYVEMYRRLIGPYPYGKFALVENFWETGYGMPSFTLLGPQIIRFPFILTSSYPHEILHNWWGNSVFVDYDTGNWCEGLTAYMADHLLKEQGGQGAEFRRDALKKYRDYVKEGRDFPLTAFRSRHSAATEAVGYGKTLMLFHMLRREVGDDAFRKALARFYREYRGKRASFADVRAAFAATTGKPLDEFFAQWVERVGAPRLAVEDATVQRAADAWRVTGMLVQQQPGAAYTLAVPLHVTTQGGDVHVERLRASAKSTPFTIGLASKPLLLEVDPELDVFRLLDARETAASIGQIFGEPRILAVLPAKAPAEQRAAYRRLAEAWRSDAHQIEIVDDSMLSTLPPDRAVWVLGRDNAHARGFPASVEAQTTVVVQRHPRNAGKALGWIVVEPAAAFEGLARKLPHYGKYSYLGFEGAEPTNTVKGEGAAEDSPLRFDVRPPDERATALRAGVPPKRAALAELPAVFSEASLRAHVERLASPEFEGRGVGTAGLEKAAQYVAEQFRAAGLSAGAAANDFMQTFRLPAGPGGRPVEVRNVVGYLPAAGGAETAKQAVLITAHYDHLGRGWPGARTGDAGKVHPGADDNASGVAVLLELAKVYAAAGKPARNLVFVAFSAEEAGLRGSRHYVEHPVPMPLDGIRAVVNLDTVGRLGAGELSALATGTASEWPHIFRGVGFTTGIKVKSVEGATQSSDQQSFIEKGIPGVQLFTGANLDYHRPTDTADKIDASGLVKVATVVRETVDYLLDREQPLTVTIAGRGDARTASAGPTNPRRASLGTVPDFTFAGPGVRVESVVPASPAAAAGIQPGDVITAMDGQAIKDLQAYSDLLKTKSPGSVVKVSVRRGEIETVKNIALAQR